MNFNELMQLSDAEICFTGLGPYDVFDIQHSRYVGTVICDLAAPPFVRSQHAHFNYAPGFVIFPKGLVAHGGAR